MPKILLKSRLHSNKNKPKTKQEINITKSTLPPHLQSFRFKLLSENGFVVYKYFIYFTNELRRFSINR